MAQYSDLFYTSHDGLTLYARDYGHKNSARTVICLPGLTRNSADFEGLCAELADDFRLLAVDLRGRGRSAYDPNPLNYHPGTYVRDIDTLCRREALDSASFIGTSLGGLVSMMLADERPEFVERIVLNDIGPELDPAGVDRIRRYVSASTAPADWNEATALTRELHGAVLPNLSDDEWRKFTKRLYRAEAGSAPMLNYDEHIADLFSAAAEPATEAQRSAMWDLYSRLKNIPIFALRGEFSDILSARTLAEMGKCNAHFQTLEVPKRGHAPLLDEPGVMPAIRKFLEGV